ncbi:MAG: hypothetical protein Q8L88_09715 [Bacteroidota bacterium]|nr:hypothetical protein [Bacteroidota bacterium]
MKTFNKIYFVVIVVLLAGLYSCENTSTTDSYTVTVSGQVLNANGVEPQDSVQLILTNPFRNTDTTKTDGSFNYSFTSEDKNEVTTNLRFHHLNNTFFDTTVSVSYSSTKKSISIEMRMKGISSAIDSITPSKPSARAGAIYFLSSGNASIAIAGTGGIEVSNLTFEVRDSVGIPVDSKNTATILFKLKSNSNLGESLNVDSAKTSSVGLVSVQLRSGSKAGLAQVQAYLKSDTTIKSPIISIPIHGGPPDSAHFSIGIGKINLPGGVKTGISTLIDVMVADKFGNPVQQGTPVQFTTTGGVVEPFGLTTSNGRVSVQLTTGNPVPSNGIARVTAEIPSGSNRTIAAPINNNNTIAILDKYISRPNQQTKTMGSFSRSVDVLFSGASTITFADNNFVVPLQSERTLNFTVSDPLGHPLSEGSTIRVIGFGFDSSGVVLSGDIERTLPDTKDPSYTQFSFVVADKRTVNVSQSKTLSLSIEVSSPNGNIKKSITGFLGSAPIDTTGKPVSSRQPAQIAFVNATTSDIFVSGVGGTETSTLTYEVRDSLGFPIDLGRRVGANFSIQFFPNSFTGGGTAPTIIPSIDSSDNQGRVRVTIVSGTQAGVVQVVTNVKVSVSKTITSQPVKVTVHAGFADQNHFTMAAPAYNFPGLDLAFITRTITVQVGDKYSNPVIAGTAVYFNSAHGTMTTGGLTSVTGFVSNTLNSANPWPQGKDTLIPDAEILSYYPSTKGFSRVYAQTIGKDGQTVIDSILLLWTGSPRFTNTGANSFAVANGGSSGPFTFTIADRFGHPMSAGTIVTVAVSTGKISGDISRTIPDAFVGGSGITAFSVFLADAATTDIDPPENSTILVTVIHPMYGQYQFTLANGTVD